MESVLTLLRLGGGGGHFCPPKIKIAISLEIIIETEWNFVKFCDFSQEAVKQLF